MGDARCGERLSGTDCGCEYSAGHGGYHRNGIVTWLGGATADRMTVQLRDTLDAAGRTYSPDATPLALAALVHGTVLNLMGGKGTKP